MLNMILESRSWQFPATARCGHTIGKLYVFRTYKFKQRAYVTKQKSLQAYSMYSLQSFTILLWSPILRKCSSLGLHVA